MIFSAPELIWFAIGLLLITAEFIIPGVFIVFFGLGSLICSGTTYLGWTSSTSSQVAVMLISSIISLIFLRKYFSNIFGGKKFTEKESEEFNFAIGSSVEVIERIDSKTGKGKVKYQGSIWEAESEDIIEEHEIAVLVGHDNLKLKVKKK
ncbi:MAG: hypothetical protein CSB55_07060 [Candidatus Cloacimonadota bacterium]|nr:MAG: hypothetical protein CSB55_07060 [Candidatus Cloacimonadota bacterium]